MTAPTVAVPARVSPLAALASREFRVFWAGFLVYCVATGMQTYGLGYLTVQLAVREGAPERGSLYLGLVGLSASIPALALGLFGGVIADRRERRGLLLFALAGFAAAGLALGGLTLIDRMSLVALLALSAINSAVMSLWVPARQAIQAGLVGERRIMSAFGLNALALNLGFLIGPLIGGRLIEPFGIAGVLIVPAVLYAIVAFLYLALAAQPVSTEARSPRVLAALAEGLRYVRDDPNIRWLMLLFAAATVLVRPYSDLLPAVAKSIGADAIGLSQLVAAVGGGSLFAGFITASADAIPRKGLVVALGFTVAGIALALMATQTALVPAVALVVLLSFCLMTASGIIGAFLQYATPDRLRGRIVGVQSLLIGGGMPAGTLTLGALGATFGIGPVLAISGLLVAAFSIAAIFSVGVLRGD